jgi:hypothetical protein
MPRDKLTIKGSMSDDRYILLAGQPGLVPVLLDWFYDEWGRTDPDSSRERMRRILGGHLNKDKIH